MVSNYVVVLEADNVLFLLPMVGYYPQSVFSVMDVVDVWKWLRKMSQ